MRRERWGSQYRACYQWSTWPLRATRAKFQGSSGKWGGTHTWVFLLQEQGSWGICTPNSHYSWPEGCSQGVWIPWKGAKCQQATKCRCKPLEVRSLSPDMVSGGGRLRRTPQWALHSVLLAPLPGYGGETPLGMWFPPFLLCMKVRRRVRKNHQSKEGLYQSRNHSSVIVPNLFGAGISANWHRFISSLHKASEQKRKLSHNNPLQSRSIIWLWNYKESPGSFHLKTLA